MKLLVTGAWAYTENDLQRLRNMGHEIILMHDEKSALPEGYASIEGVIGNGLFQYHDITEFTNLEYIQLTSAGLDRVPLEYIQNHHITLRNASGVYSIPLAEFAVADVLYFYKQLFCFREQQKKHEWNKIRTLPELNQKTVCICGCGSVGTACANRFKSFGCRILGFDLYPKDGFEMVPLDYGLRQADIVILTLPLTNETRHIINADTLSLLKEGCVLVNIARGGLIDTQALSEHLHTRRLYAALDVFEDEPLFSDSDLWDEDNLLITPHNSFVGDGNRVRLTELIIRGLEEFTYENINYRTQK